MFLKRTNQALLLSSLVALTTINCAQANDFGDLIQSWTGGNYNNLTAQNQLTTRNNLQARISQLRNDSDIALRSNQISHSEMINMNSELDRIANMEASYGANGMTFGEAQSLVGQLDTTALRLTNYGYDEVSPYPNYQANNYRSNTYGFANLNDRTSQMQRRIDLGSRNGRLNQMEANRLRAQLDRIQREESTMRQGGLSAWERQTLIGRYDQFGNRLNGELNDSQIAGRRSRWY
ncbi:MAG: hypothetical protein IAF58_12875 [Leptolyngbya sp.]|nr:hypothetical protein [Candidatus Melainabacteria bacterium]